MKYNVTFEGRVVVASDGGSVDNAALIEEHLDQVMDELITLGTEDPFVSADLGDGTVSFSFVVDASNPVLAATHGSGAVRSAIHASGGCTPDWPSEDHDAWAVRLVDMRSSEVEGTVQSAPDDCGDLIGT